MCCDHSGRSTSHSTSCCCCCTPGFRRRFLTKGEEKERLENYLEKLKKEQEGVQERLNQL